jgi:hypothetical protein
MNNPMRKTSGKTPTPKLSFSGWKTMDEDEIARRRPRASVEAMKIEPMEPDHPIYGTFSSSLLGVHLTICRTSCRFAP